MHPQGVSSTLILDTVAVDLLATWPHGAPRLREQSVLVFRIGSVNNITRSRMWWRDRVILTAALLLVRNYSARPQSGRWSRERLIGMAEVFGMSRTDSLTSVIEMQEEYCIRIKWKTILTQTAGAVARENKLIEELSAPCGLVVRPAAESMIRLNMH